MNYADLINTITTRIATNGQQAITAQVLQDVLVEMVQEMGQSGALVGGVVDTSYVPDPSNDAQLIYIAQGIGTYPNFGGLTVVDGEVAFFYYDGNAWQKSSVSVNVAVEVIDNLSSTATDKALSANQGRVLDEKKADKVSGATAGNMAGLDADGNLVDSGVPASAVGDVADKIDKVHDAEVGNVPMFKADGGIEDGGVAADNIAEQDGYYETMVVGGAENLIGSDIVASQFTRRKTGGSTDAGTGVAILKTIKGNTLVWNQYATANFASGTTNGVTFTFNSTDKTIDLSGTLSTTYAGRANTIDKDFIVGHKYYYKHRIIANPNSLTFTLGLLNQSGINSGLANYSTVWTAAAVSKNWGINSGTANDNFNGVRAKMMIVDLTQMFGSGNEPSTAAEFEALFPLNYYDNVTPFLLNLTATGLQTNGFNQLGMTGRTQYPGTGTIGDTTPKNFSESEYWNGITSSGIYNHSKSNSNLVIGEGSISGTPSSSGYGVGFPVKCFPNTTYYIKSNGGASTRLGFYDINGLYLSNANKTNETFTTPTDCYWVVVIFGAGGSAYSYTDINVNLSDVNKNGTYEPYWIETKALPITTATSGGVAIFSDGLKSAGTAYDRYYKSAGSDLFDKAERVILKVDLGTLAWGYTGTYFAVSAAGLNMKQTGVSEIFYKNAKYTCIAANQTFTDKELIASGTYNYIRIKDTAYTDSAVFRAAMSGVWLYYEAQTPTDYTLDTPFSGQYKVDNDGTETILPENTSTPTTSPIVADINYALNAIDTIRNLPKNYISKASMDAILTAFKTAGVITNYTLTWDATNQKYNCTITP